MAKVYAAEVVAVENCETGTICTRILHTTAPSIIRSIVSDIQVYLWSQFPDKTCRVFNKGRKVYVEVHPRDYNASLFAKHYHPSNKGA